MAKKVAVSKKKEILKEKIKQLGFKRANLDWSNWPGSVADDNIARVIKNQEIILRELLKRKGKR